MSKILGNGSYGTVVDHDTYVSKKQAFDVLGIFINEVYTMHILPPHKNIAPIMDVYKTSKKLAYTMPRYKCSLNHYIAPDIDKVISILADVTAGLAHIHAHGIVHADLKTSNIMLEGGGDSGNAVIIDFGMAHPASIWPEWEIQSEHVRSPENCEITVRSPNTVRRTIYGGYASDVWSVGVVALQLMGLVVTLKTNTDILRCNLLKSRRALNVFVDAVRFPETPERDELLSIVALCFINDHTLRPTAQELHRRLIALAKKYDIISAVRRFCLAPLPIRKVFRSQVEIENAAFALAKRMGGDASIEAKKYCAMCHYGYYNDDNFIYWPEERFDEIIETLCFS